MLWNLAKKAPVFPIRVISAVANAVVYGVKTGVNYSIINPTKKYIIEPTHKILDGKINSLKASFKDLVVALVPELKENLAEQLRVAWKAANPGNPNLDKFFQNDLGQVLDKAINFSTNAAEEIDKSNNQLDGLAVAITLAPNIRGALKPALKIKFKLHIELTDEFAKVFSNEGMESVRKVNAEDVLKKAADSFFTERGYSANNLDISVRTQPPKKNDFNNGSVEPITMYRHLLEEKAAKEAAKKGAEVERPKTNGTKPPLVAPKIMTPANGTGAHPS